VSFGIPVRNGLGVGLLASTSLSTRNRAGFSPASLFAAGEPGVWYDPSDFSTMFQESTGVTPVTAAGQSVGFLGDKSQGFVLGSELVGAFTAYANASFSTVGGVTTITCTANGSYGINLGFSGVAGKTYLVSFTVVSNSAPRGVFAWSSITSSISLSAGTTTGAKIGRLQATAGGSGVIAILGAVAGETFSVSNISVRELAGNHATQSTAASRPILGRVPVGGRRNLLTFTEEFDNAAWNKQAGTVVTANQAVAPDGTTTADLVVGNGTNGFFLAVGALGTGTVATTKSIYLRGVSGGETVILKDAAATIGTTTCNLTTAWQRFTLSETVGVNSQLWVDDIPAGGIYVWGAQLETGSTATAYQRVVTAFDVTQAGVADCYYLSFDGSDDFLVTGTITPGTDKAQVFAGVRKLSDAGQGTVAALGSVGSDVGSFELGAPGGAGQPNYAVQLRGNAGLGGWTYSTYTAPITNVATALFDLADVTASGQNKAAARFNGVVNAGTWSTGNAGAGNFGAYPLYLGRRATFLHFNGQLFGLVTRFGANLTADQITQAETWVGGKTGVNIPLWQSKTIYNRSEVAILDRANETIEVR
jgi:hypothetical protein